MHAAADVKLGASFSQLEAANITGTRNALELAGAARNGAGPAFLHVSTNGIFPARGSADEVISRVLAWLLRDGILTVRAATASIHRSCCLSPLLSRCGVRAAPRAGSLTSSAAAMGATRP